MWGWRWRRPSVEEGGGGVAGRGRGQRELALRWQVLVLHLHRPGRQGLVLVVLRATLHEQLHGTPGRRTQPLEPRTGEIRFHPPSLTLARATGTRRVR